MVYGIAWRAWQDIWYGLAGMAWYMVLPGEVWDGIWCGLADDMYMVWPDRHVMVYGTAWWASNGICIGLARCGMVRYCLVGYGMVYGMACRT